MKEIITLAGKRLDSLTIDETVGFRGGKIPPDIPWYRNSFSWTIDDSETINKIRNQMFIKSMLDIKKIVENPLKGATTVIWSDGDVTVVKRAEGDPDDPYFAVASALAIRVYGSNSAFKRLIDTKYEVFEPKKKGSKND